MQINMQEAKLIPVSWMQPHPGGSSLMCSKCSNPDYHVFAVIGQLRCPCGNDRFAVHVDPVGKDSAAVRETICTSCLEQTKLKMDGAVDGRVVNGLECCGCKSRMVLEANALIDRRGEFIDKRSKRRIFDEQG